MSDYGISISNGEETTDTLRVDTSWDKNGLFTEIRCFFNGELSGISSVMKEDGEMVPFENKDAEIEKYLYDEKGYPRRCFYFEYDGLWNWPSTLGSKNRTAMVTLCSSMQ